MPPPGSSPPSTRRSTRSSTPPASSAGAKDTRMSSGFRITQRSVATSSLAGLQAALARLQETQTKLSSGKAIQRPSDSPTGTMVSLRLRADVDRYDQLDRNAADGLCRLGTTDNALTDGLSTLRDVRNLVVQGSNASLSAS